VSTTTEIAGLGNYVDAFTGLQKTGSQPEWLRHLREDAFARFCEAGFPTTKEEDWRFTNTAPIAQLPFAAGELQAAPVRAEDLQPYLLPETSLRMVFVNGRFAPELSSMQLPAGVEAGNLAELIGKSPKLLEEHLGRYLDTQRDAFASLNTAFFQDGAYLSVAANVTLQTPVHLLFLNTEANGPQRIHPRNLIFAGRNSKFGIVEDHLSLGESVAFVNTVTELVAEENATVYHHTLERQNLKSFHISTLRIQHARAANVHAHSVLIGGALVRNNVHPVLAGDGGECVINGLFLGEGTQHIDNYMMVEHASAHCASHQYYNGILDGHAHGVFHGRILVHKDAQRTDAKQTNRNLLLSDDARIDTKPQLEIYADDVKCTHGATIGQIEENALFYLRSRGLDEATAREMLLLAFAGQCMVRIETASIRKHVEKIVRRALFLARPSITASQEEME
jgi:Fe-S cluster assembly protein SufD